MRAFERIIHPVFSLVNPASCQMLVSQSARVPSLVTVLMCTHDDPPMHWHWLKMSCPENTCTQALNHTHLRNTAQHCSLGLFQDSDFVGDLEDSESTSGGAMFIFGSHTFVPTSWMCKKQTSVSCSSAEAGIIPSMQVYAWTVFQLLISGIW